MEYDFHTEIILIADDFYDAYRRCCEGMDPVQNGNAVKFSAPNVPAIVNGAFALELYFKCMLKTETQGHKLKALFDSLADDIKEEIKNSVSEKLNLLAWGNSFEQYIEDIDNVFVDWRYIYEKDYEVGFLGNKVNEYLQVLAILLPTVKKIAHKYALTQEKND